MDRLTSQLAMACIIGCEKSAVDGDAERRKRRDRAVDRGIEAMAADSEAKAAALAELRAS